jgi:hypothetical protein
MTLIHAIAFLMLLTLRADSPEPESVVVSQFRIVRRVLVEARHEVTKNRCYRILHLKDIEVEYEEGKYL